MRNKVNNWWSDKLTVITKAVKSKQFFWVILAIFIFESLWVALSAVYPMAFDEDFHLGIIKFYAGHLNPFFSHQPANTYVYGAISRDPSYLYQYLMSFPYRLISLFTKSSTTQIIALRIINVGIFAGAIYLFKLLFDKFTKLSPLMINLVLLFFVLTPIVPQLAGQINYDSLFLLTIPLTLYLFFSFVKDLKSHNKLNVNKGLLLLSACMLASLVKYAYLPIFLAIGMAVLIIIAMYYKSLKKALNGLKTGFLKTSRSSLILLLAFTALSFGLFFQRYGINMIDYHNPIPDCAQVLTINDCKQYSPWDRNYEMLLAKVSKPDANIFKFTGYWLGHALQGITFAANGKSSGYIIGNPLPIVLILFAVTFLGGIVTVIYFGRKILWNKPVNRLLMAVIIFYLGALWLQNYSDYLHFGQTVAIQGRYWIPVLIPILILIGQTIAHIVREHPRMKTVIVIYFLVLLLQGGGLATFVFRSDNSWYWQNSVVYKVNQKSRTVLNHILIS